MMKKVALLATVFTGSLLITNGVQAQQVQSIMECTKISDNTSRLACYDAAAGKITSLIGGQNSNASETPKKTSQKDSFGNSQLRSSPVKSVREANKEDENTIKEFTFKVVKYVYTSSKKFVLYTENGQIWKQHDGGRVRLPKGEFDVIIKKGVFGGFNAIVPTKRSIIKVKRLK